MARTREALFSMLEARGVVWDQIRALDLFAGCGSVGLEALSRGALSCDFVDNGTAACQCLSANIAALDIAPQARIIKSDALKFLRIKPASPYNLVFLDPPYRQNYPQCALAALAGNNWLGAGAFICAEIEKDALIKTPETMQLLAVRKFGQTTLHLWTTP